MESHPSGFIELAVAVINVRLPSSGARLVSNGHMERMPSNESPSDLEQRLAAVVLAEVMQHRTPDPATTRFVRGTLDEGDTQPFTVEEPTQQSMPYDRVEVEMEVDLGTAPAPKYPPAVELQLSASKNLVMDTVQVAKFERDELVPKKKIPTTKKMAAAPRPKQAKRATTAVTRTTQKTKIVRPGPSALAMTLAFVFGAVAFMMGLGLARLMM